MMIDILENTYSRFLADMEKGETYCHYLDVSSLEDDYSHKDIEKAITLLVNAIREWLAKNRPGKYFVLSGWCVSVITLEEAEERNFSSWDVYR